MWTAIQVHKNLDKKILSNNNIYNNDNLFYCPGGNYTQEEMRVALIILIVILCVFFALCTCQCYNRVRYECSDNTMYDKKNGCVPEAPYYRDSSQTTSNPAAGQSTLGGSGPQQQNEAMLASLVKL